MGTRYYDFTSAFDQVSAPTGSSPSGTSDFVTVGYGVSNYARYIDTIANLKAVSSSYRADGVAMWVDELLAWFYFDSASSATGDDENTITPSAGTGRWLRMQVKGFGAVQNVATSATIAAMASSTPVVRLTGSTATDLQGITAGIGEQILELYNASSASVTLKHENGSASAANRLSLQQSADLEIKAGGAMLLRYDKTLTRWVPASGGGGGSAGGGASLEWFEDTDAPIFQMLSSHPVWRFSYGVSQYLYGSLRVPQSYVAGSPIKVLLPVLSLQSADTNLMQTLATLVRTGTDAYTSTTNQRTSTNSAVTNTGGTQNKFQTVTLDLTSTTGTINSVAVDAGDLILVRLTRGTDTNNNDIFVPAFSSEVTFS